MSDDAPPSLESRMLLDSLKSDRAYPFLRAVRSLLVVVAILYGLLGVVAAMMLMADEISKDMRTLVEGVGGPATGTGLLASTLVLVAVSLRVIVLLALREGIQLLLDVRQAQRDLVAKLG